MKNVLALVLLFGFSLTGLAHEGHDNTPGSISAPHGGQIKSTKDMFLEVLYDGGKLKIYPFDHDMKALSLRSIKMKASVKLPKRSKSEELDLVSSSSFWEAKVSAKGVHRFTLDLNMQRDSKSEKVTFTIEP